MKNAPQYEADYSRPGRPDWNIIRGGRVLWTEMLLPRGGEGTTD